MALNPLPPAQYTRDNLRLGPGGRRRDLWIVWVLSVAAFFASCIGYNTYAVNQHVKIYTEEGRMCTERWERLGKTVSKAIDPKSGKIVATGPVALSQEVADGFAELLIYTADPPDEPRPDHSAFLEELQASYGFEVQLRYVEEMTRSEVLELTSTFKHGARVIYKLPAR